jgi:hypothetical protein
VYYKRESQVNPIIKATISSLGEEELIVPMKLGDPWPMPPIEVSGSNKMRHFPDRGIEDQLTIMPSLENFALPSKVLMSGGMQVYFRDEEIINVKLCPSDFNRKTPNGMPYGITKDGRTIIEQQSLGGCLNAC